jgi:hypothetical protein
MKYDKQELRTNRGYILVNDLLDVRKNGGFIWITKLDDFCVEKVKIEAIKD